MTSLGREIFDALAGSRDRLVIALNEIAERALAGSVGEMARAEAFFDRGSNEIGAEVTRFLPPGWICRISASFVPGARPAGRDDRYIVELISKKFRASRRPLAGRDR